MIQIPHFTIINEPFHLANRSWVAHERALLNRLNDVSGGFAQIYTAQDGIVVPRRYALGENEPAFARACEALAARGLPVSVRLSGGGVVPQSADVLNIHLAYRVQARTPLQVAEQHYQWLCDYLSSVLQQWGIVASAQEVHGSFCDGRYNLAVNGKKIVGTAQHWQRETGSAESYRVLSHAVLLLRHAQMLTEWANEFEAAMGSAVRYQPSQTTDVADYATISNAKAMAALVEALP